MTGISTGMRETAINVLCEGVVGSVTKNIVQPLSGENSMRVEKDPIRVFVYVTISKSLQG